MNQLEIDGICRSSEEWTKKLHDLIDSERLQKEMVQNGQQYIRDTHSEELILQAWDRVFESVL